jgi:hypothetical protein
MTLTLEDIGCRVRVAYTPVRGDGVQGDELTATTDIVVEGETCSNSVGEFSKPPFGRAVQSGS